MFHVKHGSPSKSDKIKCFTWNKPAYKITPRFYRTGYPGPLAKRHTVSPPALFGKNATPQRLSSAAKGIASKFAACFWNSDFPFIPLLQAFDMLCACMHRNSAKNCFTWNNPFKGRRNSLQKNRHIGSTRAFHKMRAHRSHRQIGAPAFTRSLCTAIQARPAILKILYKTPHITPQLTAIKSKTRRWIHS